VRPDGKAGRVPGHGLADPGDRVPPRVGVPDKGACRGWHFGRAGPDGGRRELDPKPRRLDNTVSSPTRPTRVGGLAGQGMTDREVSKKARSCLGLG